MHIIICITYLLLPVAAFAQNHTDMKTYTVKPAGVRPAMSGKGNDAVWKTAEVLSDFLFPWENDKPLPTQFRALHDSDWLYGLFEITDPAAHVEIKNNHKMEVAASSRAEIFFKANDLMNPYFGLEIDPAGRVLDYRAYYHRRFDYDWSWPQGHLLIKTDQRSDGYTIEFAISKASLKALDLLNNNVLQAGIFRADCTPTAGDPQFRWASWLRPDSATPDFHIPSSFGILKLVD